MILYNSSIRIRTSAVSAHELAQQNWTIENGDAAVSRAINRATGLRANCSSCLLAKRPLFTKESESSGRCSRPAGENV